MKVWTTIFVICLLASTVQGVFAAQQSKTDTDEGLISEAPLNPEYLAYKNAAQAPESEKKGNSEDQLGYIPEPADSSHLKGMKIPKKALEAEVQGIADAPVGDTIEILSAPATYDLRTSGRVSPVKNQGSCGSCWAFASYGSLESEALSAQAFDFSENNLKNTAGFDLGPCAGGNAQMATAYLSRWSGAVAETSDPYTDSSVSNSPAGLPVQEHVQEILTIPGRSGSLDNTNIKAALQTTGALYTTMYWSATYYNATSKAYYYSGSSASNHAVTIVGWDDAYSRKNFKPAAPGDGAFIIKNSWGTSWGNSGYFYLSYYDARVGKSLTAFTGESAANYNHIYQYDPLGWTSSMGYGTTAAWAANVFTAGSAESLKAVGFSTNQVNTSYRVSIYTDPTQGPLNSAGPVSTVQGTITVPGTHSVTLPTPVPLKAGQKFSVVVRFQTPNYNYPITIEKPVSGYSSLARAGAGQSYISSTGTSWTDLTSSIPNANTCVKAYTVNTATTVPVTAFSGTPTSGTAPLTVQFTDSSSNSPTSWSWTFGDGSTSTTKSPSHQYTKAGNYTVSLTAKNAAGSKILTKTGYIKVSAAPVVPVTAFAGTPTSGTAPLTVQFTDSSSNSPTSWAWTFGDGSTSTTKNPSHQYTKAGNYTVSLTAKNAAGSKILTKTGYIKVSAVPVVPVTAFSGTPTSGTAPITVQFTDSSSNSPTSWAWTFGDGSTSTTKSPSHQYTKAGNYTVSLTAKNAAGSKTLTKTGYIKVTTPLPAGTPPTAQFIASPRQGVTPISVQFTDQSVSAGTTTYYWEFKNEGVTTSTSTVKNPSIRYTLPGNKTIKLTVTNAYGTDSETKTNYIKVTPAP